MKAVRPGDPADYVALCYMTRFRCVGAECEDSCCGEWAVRVDDAHHEALRRTMGQTDAGRAEFASAVVYRVEDGQKVVALLAQRDDRSCAFLGEDRLCTVQRRYGEDLLPDDCAVYPRSVGRIHGRVELSGNLSCPEAARLCLLAPDSTDLVPVDPALVVRGLVHYDYEDSPRDVSEAALDAVRDTARYLLALRDRSLDERLFFLSVFLDSASLLVGPAAGPRAHVHFGALLQSVRQEAAREELSAQFTLAEPSAAEAAEAAEAVARVLNGAAKCTASFRRLLDEVFSTGLGGVPSLATAVVADAAARGRADLPAATAVREDELLERFCQNHLVRLWPIWSASLRSYGLGLLLRVAAARLLLRNHPHARSAGAEPARVDAVAVRVVHTLSRAVDHEGTLRGIIESFVESGSDSLETAVALLKL